MSPFHKLSISTVTAPFTGMSTSFDPFLIQRALGNIGLGVLGQQNLVIKKPSFFITLKAGVNASQALMSAPFDLAAIMLRPRV